MTLDSKYVWTTTRLHVQRAARAVLDPVELEIDGDISLHVQGPGTGRSSISVQPCARLQKHAGESTGWDLRPSPSDTATQEIEGERDSTTPALDPTWQQLYCSAMVWSSLPGPVKKADG